MQQIGTILLVEDLSNELESKSYFLRENGYQVMIAVTPQEAWEIAICHQPQVIVTNMVVSKTSGYELCRQLKQNMATQHLPIVLCSHKNQSMDRIWGMRQGADIYLTKPYSHQKLLIAIQSLMAQISF